MSDYPGYVHRMLAEAEALLAEDDLVGPDVAAICFEVLALFPECYQATELVYRAFCDPYLIRENRRAISRQVDEWDDRPWQQRHRLALSFGFMCRWEGQYGEDGTGVYMPEDVKDMLEEGRMQLLQDALLGQTQGRDMAWSIFLETFHHARDSQAAMLWVGMLYSDQGYFTEAVDVLEMLLAQFPRDQEARRLWAEVRWWRDNQHRIPWIPPDTGGNGRRWRKMMSQLDRDFAEHEAEYSSPLPYMPPDEDKLPADFEPPKPLSPDLIAHVEATIGDALDETPDHSVVDWNYLEELVAGEVDVSQWPAWAQYLLLEVDDPEQEAYLKQWLMGYLSNTPLQDDEDEAGDEEGTSG